MIERYFSAGRRFKWTEPRNGTRVTDGAIIDNPQMAHSPMTYLGMDGSIKKTTAQMLADNRVGLRMGARIPYKWLVYAPGRTTRLATADDVLSGPMSGCIIPVWRERGRRYVGHVGTEEVKKTDDKVKAIFAAQMEQNTIGYNPGSGVWTADIPGILANFKSWSKFIQLALVTGNDQGFSILMVQTKQPDQWTCGGIRRVTRMDYDSIRSKFLPKGRLSDDDFLSDIDGKVL